MYDVNGNFVASYEEYLELLKKVLPAKYIESKDFQLYINNLLNHIKGQKVREDNIPFYG
jgi:hypothetical protein